MIDLPQGFDRRGIFYTRLVRVVAPHFVAGFVTDGTVIEAAPILRKKLLGKTDDEARAIIAQSKWQASVVDQWNEATGSPPCGSSSR